MIEPDASSRNYSNVPMCYYCNTDDYPHGKPIINDRHAIRTEKGDFMCSPCREEESVKMDIRILGPMHPSVKRKIDEEQRTVDQWNAVANKTNDFNKKRGGKDIVKLKKNRYWSNW